MSTSIDGVDPPILIPRRNHIANVSDIAVLRVFFGNSETWRYNQDLAQYWFEIASEWVRHKRLRFAFIKELPFILQVSSGVSSD